MPWHFWDYAFGSMALLDYAIVLLGVCFWFYCPIGNMLFVPLYFWDYAFGSMALLDYAIVLLGVCFWFYCPIGNMLFVPLYFWDYALGSIVLLGQCLFNQASQLLITNYYLQ
jgi:hypothetical protein